MTSFDFSIPVIFRDLFSNAVDIDTVINIVFMIIVMLLAVLMAIKNLLENQGKE